MSEITMTSEALIFFLCYVFHTEFLMDFNGESEWVTKQGYGVGRNVERKQVR